MGKTPHREPATLPPFEHIYDQFQPLLYSTLKKYHIYRDREDILQVGRLALWEAYVNYDPRQGAFAAYATRYVRGRILNYLNRTHKQAMTVPFSAIRTEDEEQEVEWPDPASEELYQSCEWQELLAMVAQLLSPREQLIFQEHLLHDMSLSDLAAREQVSVHTVKTWKKRALKKIRRALSPTL
ncbi:DNA-directed RNA polymerase [Caldalkalibacillus uzonensis]|uniref:DNA-directed RNA polymerase n=1 Tax=Caldalkalibacillus uzonensis TaxID=353224 RepID=A0ABU0CRM7_9BACI|nr:sigma-70 family RNA polymerase sigma factor [Caldalkalibacillus uzonensis]MDQ0338521.1 DNA-directed RNA polymerase [Caldalkalibacillus uzonensis]